MQEWYREGVRIPKPADVAKAEAEAKARDEERKAQAEALRQRRAALDINPQKEYDSL